jgi:hypothetical protein
MGQPSRICDLNKPQPLTLTARMDDLTQTQLVLTRNTHVGYDSFLVIADKFFVTVDFGVIFSVINIILGG